MCGRWLLGEMFTLGIVVIGDVENSHSTPVFVHVHWGGGGEKMELSESCWVGNPGDVHRSSGFQTCVHTKTIRELNVNSWGSHRPAELESAFLTRAQEGFKQSRPHQVGTIVL